MSDISICYITIGAPGSGKSFWAKQFVRGSSGKVVNINRDDTRKMLFQHDSWRQYNFTKTREGLVTKININALKHAKEMGYDVVISDTNLNTEFLNALIAEAYDVGFTVKLVWFPTSIEVLRKRNEKRGAWAVSDNILVDMHKRMEELFQTRGDNDLVIEYEESKIYVPKGNLPKAIIFDIDGTLADMGERNPYAWGEVYQDKPKEMVVSLAKMFKQQGYNIITLSGRDGVCEEMTKQWLVDNNIPSDYHFQRKQGDMRKDDIIKEEIFWGDIANRFDVKLAVDDRNCVVNMWRKIGLECWQVDMGDF